MNITIVRLKDKQEAVQLLNYLAERGISRSAVRATIQHDHYMAQQLLGAGLVRMREADMHQVEKRYSKSHSHGGR